MTIFGILGQPPTDGPPWIHTLRPFEPVHYEPHFASDGLCQCGCDLCTLRVCGGCVCEDCPCDGQHPEVR